MAPPKKREKSNFNKKTNALLCFAYVFKGRISRTFTCLPAMDPLVHILLGIKKNTIETEG